MNNREIDELLYNLRKRMDKGLEDKELSIFLSNNLSSSIISNEFSLNDNNISWELIRKIVSDFYAYYLYKIECRENIDSNIKEIVDDIKELSCDDIIDYVKYNLFKFYIIIKKYFEYHKQSIDYQCEVMANVVNKRLGTELTGIYKEFFFVDFSYEYLLVQNNVMIGLELRDYCLDSLNDNTIIQYLNVEFENKVDRNNFLNYVLSNVYASLKINGCNSKEDLDLVKLTEQIDKKMKCFYDSDEYVINLIKKYFDIYNNVKWFEFKDIRDYISFENVELIYKLDNCYKHPMDVLKNAKEVYTVMEKVQEFLFNSIEKLVIENKDDFEILEWIKKLINNKVMVCYSEKTIFSYEDDQLFKNLIKLLLLSSFYEYCNYDLDNIDISEMNLYKYIDDGLDGMEGLSIFEDDEDCEIIINKFIDYYFSKENIELMAKKKIVQDNKFKNIIKFNPYMFLEYRRAFGFLLPLETSKSTEYGNIILGILFDIISLSDNLEDDHGIKYQDLAQMFKNDFFEIHLDLDEIIGFILSNIYINLNSRGNINDDEKLYIISMENNQLNVDDIINNDILFGELLFYFFNLNGEFLNDNKLKKFRKNYSEDKIKVLKKYDPFYEIDRDILK